MRILVSIPAISFDLARCKESLEYFGEVSRFKPTLRTFDAFDSELSDIRPKSFFGINVPHWPLLGKRGVGVAGPGAPVGELFCPASLGKKMGALAGKYDKWRPYPAMPPLSSYNLGIARRYARKRCRMFRHAALEEKWETLFYVEHSPASIAYLAEKEASLLAEHVIEACLSVSRSMPFIDMAIFSPYGIGKKDGFLVSNKVKVNGLRDWSLIRQYLLREKKHEDIRNRPGN